ncbi:MAG: hypothetical protein K8R31_08280 [Bacteroidales bacterium]|nr:hypothetical protein [Bacteroidales bacterium]
MYGFCKKILSVFFIISFPLIVFSQQTIKVQLVSISNISNNHVGNEWSHDVTVNNKLLSKHKNLEFSETDTLFIKVICNEYDEKYPDFGHNSRIIDINKIDLSKEYTFTIEVTVIENGGRYKGNTAKWKYSFKISLT